MTVTAAASHVTIVEPPIDVRWHDVAKHRFASLFSSSRWIEVVAQSFDLNVAAVAWPDGERIAAALPFCHVTDFRGRRVVCLPFSDYCDPLVDDVRVWRQLVTPLFDLGAPIRLRCLRNALPLADARFEVVGEAHWHGIDLTRSEDELWEGLAASARQNVRKALRHGVVVRASRQIEDVLLFHRMHCHVRKTKYRLLAQPRAFFDNLHAAFAPDDRILVLLAEINGEPVAGILFIEWGDTLYYKFNASFDQHLRPNDLLVWEGMRIGRQRKLLRFDFGLSAAAQPGLVRYKRKFASEQRPIWLLEWRPRAYADSSGEVAGRTLERVTRLLTDPRVPDEVTRAASDDLYRFFC
jgi:CelD/BcsL family acetyltransferase involved in cellulose biosynthesis